MNFTFNLTFGWWIAPLLVSIIGFFYAKKMCGQDEGPDNFGMGAFISGFIYLLFFVVPSLVAWLVWSLLR